MICLHGILVLHILSIKIHRKTERDKNQTVKLTSFDTCRIAIRLLNTSKPQEIIDKVCKAISKAVLESMCKEPCWFLKFEISPIWKPGVVEKTQRLHYRYNRARPDGALSGGRIWCNQTWLFSRQWCKKWLITSFKKLVKCKELSDEASWLKYYIALVYKSLHFVSFQWHMDSSRLRLSYLTTSVYFNINEIFLWN